MASARLERQALRVPWVGIYSNVRLDDRLCLLVVMGVTEHGRKELVAVDSRNTTLAMVYKLLQSAQKRWNRLKD
ncbi:hypothetical protein OURE66S_04646 [Oligella ureolytica]